MCYIQLWAGEQWIKITAIILKWQVWNIYIKDNKSELGVDIFYIWTYSRGIESHCMSNVFYA